MLKTFTSQERIELLSNLNVLKVLNSNIEFTQEFKNLSVYQHYKQGMLCKQIFKEACIPDWLNT